jgi:hypothetical protein
MAPPPDETPEQRARRLADEEEARRVSYEIDESLKRERSVQRKKKVVKLLLLGQSESGACSQHSLLRFSLTVINDSIFVFYGVYRKVNDIET